MKRRIKNPEGAALDALERAVAWLTDIEKEVDPRKTRMAIARNEIKEAMELLYAGDAA